MQSDVTLLKDFCQHWGFFYYQTRESLDFQNLVDEAFSGVYAFHAQGRINISQNSDTGFVNGKTYTGRVYFGIPTNIDGVIHNDKYDKYVYNIDRLEIEKLLIAYFCKEYTFRITSAQPFYNLFGINYDGISFDYQVDINSTSELTNEQKLYFIENGELL
jgi:hypothetical protein